MCVCVCVCVCVCDIILRVLAGFTSISLGKRELVATSCIDLQIFCMCSMTLIQCAIGPDTEILFA